MLQIEINSLINSLGCWYVDGTTPKDPRIIVEEGAKVGIMVDPRLCTSSIQSYLDSKKINPNSTFYKSWEDVVSKDRLELFVDQIIHYMSTYGTNYNGETYIPNKEPIQIPYHTYKLIRCVSCEELIEKILVLLQGIALDNVLVEACSDFLFEQHKKGYKISLDNIANKEVQSKLCLLLKIVPNSTDAIRRCIQASLGLKTTIIQGRSELFLIRRVLPDADALNYMKLVMDKLDSVPDLKLKMSQEFLRYRKWWCAVKRAYENHSEVGSFINKLREMARKTHRPFIGGFWETLTNHSDDYIMTHAKREIEKLDNPYKVVKLLEMLKLRKLQNKSESMRLFKIRNGKTYMTHGGVVYHPMYDDLIKLLLSKLVTLIARKREFKYKNGEYVSKNPTIKFDDRLDLTIPSSGKTFLGNVPFGSKCHMDNKDSFIGIYWRNEWGTHDFDLSLIDKNKSKIGWNADYHNNNVIFSGDMTNADPEAVEMMYIKSNCPQSIIKVNRYNGQEGSKYQLFFGQERIKSLYKNYMVDPNNIKLQVDLVSNQQEQTIGYIENNECYLMSFDTGCQIVSMRGEAEQMDTWGDICKAHVPLKETLLTAGYKEWDPQSEEEPDIDLTDLTKDLILSFM